METQFQAQVSMAYIAFQRKNMVFSDLLYSQFFPQIAVFNKADTLILAWGDVSCLQFPQRVPCRFPFILDTALFFDSRAAGTKSHKLGGLKHQKVLSESIIRVSPEPLSFQRFWGESPSWALPGSGGSWPSLFCGNTPSASACLHMGFCSVCPNGWIKRSPSIQDDFSCEVLSQLYVLYKDPISKPHILRFYMDTKSWGTRSVHSTYERLCWGPLIREVSVPLPRNPSDQGFHIHLCPESLAFPPPPSS